MAIVATETGYKAPTNQELTLVNEAPACSMLHFKDGVKVLIILDGCMLFIKLPTMMCLAKKKRKRKKKKKKKSPAC